MLACFIILPFGSSSNFLGITHKETLSDISVVVIPENIFIKNGDDLKLNIFIQNNSDKSIHIDKIKYLAREGGDLGVNIDIKPHYFIEKVYWIYKADSGDANLPIAVYYHSDDNILQVITTTTEITISPKLNLDIAPYLISSFIGMISYVISSLVYKKFSDTISKKETDKELIKKALLKVASFYEWADKSAASPAITSKDFWERFILQDDTLIFLQKIDGDVKEFTRVSDLVSGTLELLMLLDELTTRINEEDAHSGISLDLINKIKNISKDLSSKVNELLYEA